MLPPQENRTRIVLREVRGSSRLEQGLWAPSPEFRKLDTTTTSRQLVLNLIHNLNNLAMRWADSTYQVLLCKNTRVGRDV